MKMNSVTAQRRRTRALAWAPLTLAALAAPSVYAAEVSLPPISIGAGLRTSFTHTDTDGVDEKANDFALNSIRLYTSGSVTQEIKFIFNTEYKGDGDNSMQVMDAIARFEFSPQFNIWAGRFLPPSDRSNLYGPYYANQWAVYNDGVQDGYPSVAVGRDDGVAYWGDFDKLKVSFGVFDVPATMAGSGHEGDVITAARLQYDFWDAEPGYFLNGTYYGDKDLLAIGIAGQSVSSDNAFTADFLMEKKLPGGGVVSIESEYADYNGLGGYGVGGASKSKGYYGLGAFLFPAQVGIGKFQLLGKYASTKYETVGGDTTQDTLDVELNYVIKTFNARLSLFFLDTSFDGPFGTDSTQVGLGLQLQI